MNEQTINPIDDRFLTTKELAERWGISVWSMKKMRRASEGPPFIVTRNQACYKLSEVLKFEDGGLLSKQQLADRWGIGVRALEYRDQHGELPGKVMIGGKVRYRLNKIIALEDAQSRTGGKLNNPIDRE